MRNPSLIGGLLWIGVCLPAALAQPTANSVSPSSGANYQTQSQSFSVTYTDSAGGGDITNAQVYLAEGGWPGQSPNCNVGYYLFSGGSVGLYLVDSSGNLMGPIWPGSGSLDNGSCQVSGFGSSVSGTSLSVSFTVQFEVPMAGVNNIWAFGTNAAGASGDWTSLGFWTVKQPAITITTQPSNTQVIIDGVTGVTGQQTFYWDVNSQHTLTAPGTESGASGVQYVFTNWSDQGTGQHTVTVPTADLSFTASYATQYYLTMSVNPFNGGGVTPGTGWYGRGSQVSVSAAANGGFQFAGFSGMIGGTTNPQTVVLNAPAQITAGFNPVTPATDGLSPSTSTVPAGQSQTFTATFDDGSGATDLQNAQVYFAAGGWPGQTPNCNVGYYSFGNNLYGLYLVDYDNNNNLLGPILSDGSQPTSIADGACSIAGFASTRSGTTLTVTFTATFTPAFVGSRNDWGYATTFAGVHNDWSNFGTLTVTSPGAPDLTIYKAHSGAFAPGQAGAQYFLTVSNAGGSPTTAPVTVTDNVPSSMTATNIAGTGWSCTQPAGPCTRSDLLASGASFPPVVLTVTVASNAPSLVTNTATVSGGGEINTANNSAGDQTVISGSGTPDLTIAKTHAGIFTQGQTGATYIITVTNVGTGFTTGPNPVTVEESLPGGLTAVSISGANWNCTQPVGPCTRPDLLASGGSYDPITVTVNVNPDAPANVVNVTTVSGGGESNMSNDSANDSTAIAPYSPPSGGTHSSGLSIWPSSAQGSNFNSSTFGTVGTKFQSDVDGSVTGIRFFNMGLRCVRSCPSHVGVLYDANGNVLAQAAFSNENSYGWQEVDFGSPVAISANTVYVAAYWANYGFYDDAGGLSSGVDNGPLHALASGVSGANGVFAYGGFTPQFPTTDMGAANFWADVSFTPGPPTAQPLVVYPNWTAGQPQQLSFTFLDGNGAADIQNAQVYIDGSLTSAWPTATPPICNFGYSSVGGGVLYLVGDDGNLLPSIPQGSYSTHNSVCTVSNFSYQQVACGGPNG